MGSLAVRINKCPLEYRSGDKIELVYDEIEKHLYKEEFFVRPFEDGWEIRKR